MVLWNPAKAHANIRKHGVRFSDAATVFDDPNALTMEDRRHGEQRFVTIGADLKGHALVVVYAYMNATEDIRLISTRPAEPPQRR
ncbi:MAG: BrnT family toxin [Candidatus Eremiobacteraeota bacterium]|nr:BrnT family toxin [Candidatus Eremiobacteraeota bacterium]